jgi:hypothetical protein
VSGGPYLIRRRQQAGKSIRLYLQNPLLCYIQSAKTGRTECQALSISQANIKNKFNNQHKISTGERLVQATSPFYVVWAIAAKFGLLSSNMKLNTQTK